MIGRRGGFARQGTARRDVALILIIVALVVVAVIGLDARPPFRTSAAVATVTADSKITLAYAGDSTTAAYDSWLWQLDDSRIRPVGGFAHSGFTSEQVLHDIHPVKADVLVVMIGINDFHFAATDNVSDVVADVNRIVRKVGARRQIISAVAPSDITKWPRDGANSQVLQTELNLALKRDAQEHHWTFTDPYSTLRDRATGGYTSTSLTVDGIHPTSASYEIVRNALVATILQVVQGSRHRATVEG